MFEFTFGDVGSGKSLAQAKDVLWCLSRSCRIEKQYSLPIREIWANFHMSPEIQDRYSDRLFYWQIPQQMIFEDYPDNKKKRKNFDCFWDEMAVELPSDKWKDTDPSIRRFFAQHRKRGVQIFGNTQDYMMLDINCRRMATKVMQTAKVIGNRDPSPTLPPIRTFWGLIFRMELDKQSIRSDDMNRKRIGIIPELIWITRKICMSYDTGEDIDKTEAHGKLQHVEYVCDKCKKNGMPERVWHKLEHLKT